MHVRQRASADEPARAPEVARHCDLAAAVVVGGVVMVTDPIFQGLAVALMSGAVVATLLTMVVVPILYWELRRRELTRASHPGDPYEQIDARVAA